jgi:hypothetical protein
VSKVTLATLLALSLAVAVGGCSKEGAGKNESAANSPAAKAEKPAHPAPPTPEQMLKAHQPANAAPAAIVDLSGIAKGAGGKTVAEVYAEKDQLKGQKVAVRGKVVKLNTGIMGVNWLHVRDGSGADKAADLTVTAAPSGSVPKVGDTVVVTGTVVVNKDFGMGYAYDVLLENAEVKAE